MGLKPSYSSVRRLIGKGGDKLVPELTGESAETEKMQRVSKLRTEIFTKNYLPHLKAFPRVREWLLKMQESGLKLGIASSAKKEELEKLLDLAQVKDLLQSKTSSDDAENSKPDPDIIEAARKKLGFSCDEVVMVGDTPYDIEAGTRAGIQTVALKCGGWDEKGLHGAIQIFEDAADILQNYASSVFFIDRGPAKFEKK